MKPIHNIAITALHPQNASTISSGFNLTHMLSIGVTLLLSALVAFIIYTYYRKGNKNLSQKLHSLNQHTSTRSTDIGTILYQIVNHIPYSACIVNSEGRISVSNVQFIAQCGKNRNELFQQIWHEALKINVSDIDISLNREKSYTINHVNHSSLKITTKPIILENLQVSLCSIVIENITHIESNLSDIEFRKKYFKEIIDKTNLALLVEDYEGHILEANIAACELLEIDYNSLKNKRILDFTPGYQHDLMQDRFNPNNEHDKLRTINHLITQNNNEVPVSISTFEIDYYGTNVHFFLIKDVSEKVRIETEMKEAKRKAEESDRLKSSFLANMSHEIRTPMNSIMGFTELMCDDQISNLERKEFHNIIKSSANNLLNLINDIMEFSKIESGIIKLKNEDLSVNELFHSLEEYAKNLLQNQSNVEFIIDYPTIEESAPIIETDQYRVEQVLRQLINNAVKFTYKGEIRVKSTYQKDGSIEFMVSDTGIGIPKEKTSSIFQKFRQANDENSRDFGGAGLGLSICQHLTKSLGGYLWLKSKEDAGSTFRLTIPQYNIAHLSELNKPRILIYRNNDEVSSHLSFIPTHQRICVYSKEALQHIPESNDIAVIILETPHDLSLKQFEEEQVQKQYPILLYEKGNTNVIYSPIEEDKGRVLSNSQDLMLFINDLIQS
ncbi:ATP-binding protein [Carboxylicivirga sp. N1Y90]|uniref:PAS domain-containing sensor histidine kinase n=1 Tax=Carboxylicivirga fragile TaxID=3417571 RepID=UPI003D33D541|nr:PAS domain S-box protein [Marinilabiliaceae bacterium N1Y90]